MKKTINIPDKYEKEIEEKINNIKEYYGLSSVSGVCVVGIDLINWIITQEKEGYKITAEKQKEDVVYIKKLPLQKSIKKE